MKVVLVGQPNSGKSTLFNAVAGYRSLTSNFAGTTVEYTHGKARVDGETIDLIDLPGLYSLNSANPAGVSSREFLLRNDWDVLINVVDASQLARSLELTIELLDLQAPLILCLNMMDEAARKGIVIDAKALAVALGVPVREAIAGRGQGVVETFRAAKGLYRRRPFAPPVPLCYPPELEASIEKLAYELREIRVASSGDQDTGPVLLPIDSRPSGTGVDHVVAPPTAETAGQALFPPPRFEALQLLRGDPNLLTQLGPKKAGAVRHAQAEITRHFNQPPDTVISSARHAASLNLFELVARVTRPRSDWREQADRLIMHPVLGYVFLGIVFLGFFHLVFDLGKIGETRLMTLFDSGIALLGQSLGEHSMRFALAKGALLGTAGAIANVLPYLVPFLIGLALLEDAGYLARVGYLMDAAMHRLGLHGTAMLPVLLGYGCSVPAVLATRILPSRRDRFVAACLAVLVPCSARMTVIFALVGFYLGANYALGIYALNLAIVAVAGYILTKIWPEISPGMLMEVPPYHRPSLRVVLLKTWWRLREFVIIAAPLLIAGSALLGAIEFLGWERFINTLLSPLTTLLGLPPAVGLTLVFGVLRKELSLLMLMQALGTTQVATVLTTGQILIFTLFVTFYLPCLATLATLAREIGWKLTAVASAALFVLAMVISLTARGLLHFLV
jgi:ferrous iron transport protein B